MDEDVEGAGLEESLSKSEEITRLKAQVFQLKNIIKKLTQQDDIPNESGKGKKKQARKFDPNLYTKRHVLFQVAYFGWDYHGFAVQEIAGKTIESELFRALTTTRLIQSRDTSNYHRCGRTDKGVSSFRQVISIDVRSNMMTGDGVIHYEGCRARERLKEGENPDHIEEIDYCKILNSNLPYHIQVLAWAPCKDVNFSARFDCLSRTYKYFFPLGDMCLDRINEAGQHLLGEHDFRNFCKMDVNNGVVNYTRRIDAVHAQRQCGDKSSSPASPFSMCILTIKGKAFLWHQIRCIVAVLFRVGDGRESPNVIKELLDIEKNPRRPQYNLASEIPLNLFDCEYADVQWNYNRESVEFVLKQFQALWTEHRVKADMIRTCLSDLEAVFGNEMKVVHQAEALLPMSKMKTYIPLLEMKKCPSLEEKISVSKKMRMSH